MNHLENLLSANHPDVKYLRQDHISLVLSRALSETYSEQPNDPVEYFAKFLLQQCQSKKVAEDVRIFKFIITDFLESQRKQCSEQ